MQFSYGSGGADALSVPNDKLLSNKNGKLKKGSFSSGKKAMLGDGSKLEMGITGGNSGRKREEGGSRNNSVENR